MLKYIIILALIIWFVCYKDSVKLNFDIKMNEDAKEIPASQRHKHRRWD